MISINNSKGVVNTNCLVGERTPCLHSKQQWDLPPHPQNTLHVSSQLHPLEYFWPKFKIRLALPQTTTPQKHTHTQVQIQKEVSVS